MKYAIAIVSLLAGCAGSVAPPSVEMESLVAKSGPLFDNCTFGVNTACTNGFHADSVCVEAPLGGGYYVETMNRLHCSPHPTCPGGANDLRLVRLCNTAAVGQDFVGPCGQHGPFGCAVCWSESECH